MRTLALFFTLVLAITSVAVAVVINAHEDWFPNNWQDLEFHEKRVNSKYNAVDAVRRSRQLGPRTISDVIKANAADCSKCFGVTDFIINFIRSTTGDAVIDDVLDGVCDKHFANSTKDASVCKDVVNAIVDLLGKGLNELDGDLHFNVSNILCADVLNLCVNPCCSASKPFQPEQRRLAFTNSRGVGAFVNITVTWMTLSQTSGDYVEYMISNADSKNVSHKSSTDAQTTSYTYGGNVGVTHAVVMPNLPQNSTITYRVGSPQGLSDWTSFKTLPVNVGTVGNRPLRLALVADMGITHSGNTIKRIAEKADSLDGFILVGDQGYDDGDERIWNVWGRMMEPIYSRMMSQVVNGNHECIDKFFPYQERYGKFNPRAGGSAPSDAMYYFLNLGPLNLFMLDSETIINTADIDAVQREWLKPILENANSQAGTFLAVMHHRPLYCSNNPSDCKMFSALLRDQVEELYYNNSVDLIQSGHLHSYERTYPVYQNKTTGNNSYFFPSAPISVINGFPGNKEGISSFRTKYDWSAFQYNEDFVYQIVEFSQSVVGDGKVHTTMSSKTHRSVDDVIIDEFSITSKR